MRLVTKTLYPSAPASTPLSYFTTHCGSPVKKFAHSCFKLCCRGHESIPVSFMLRRNGRFCHPGAGVDSFLMYSVHEGIRGIALDPNDNSEALMPITGTLFAVGVDFHAGTVPNIGVTGFHRHANSVWCRAWDSRYAADPLNFFFSLSSFFL